MCRECVGVSVISYSDICRSGMMIGAGCDILWVRRDISVLQSEGWFLTLYDLYAWSCSPSLNVTDQPNEMRLKILRWCCYVVAGFSPRRPATKLCTQGLRVIIRVSRNLPSLPATPGTNIASRPTCWHLSPSSCHVLPYPSLTTSFLHPRLPQVTCWSNFESFSTPFRKGATISNFMVVVVLVDTICTIADIDARAGSGETAPAIVILADVCLALYTLEMIVFQRMQSLTFSF